MLLARLSCVAGIAVIWCKTDFMVSIVATVLVALTAPLTMMSMYSMWSRLSRQGVDSMFQTVTETGTLNLRADGQTREVAEFYIGEKEGGVGGTSSSAAASRMPGVSPGNERTALLAGRQDNGNGTNGTVGIPCLDRR